MTGLTDLLRQLRSLLEEVDVNSLPCLSMERYDFGDRLPFGTTAVYFVRHCCRVLYIGRATNLRDRWRLKTDLYFRPDWVATHAKLKEAVDLGNASLHWLTIPRDCLAIAESVLLQIHEPPWNNHRG